MPTGIAEARWDPESPFLEPEINLGAELIHMGACWKCIASGNASFLPTS